MRTGFRLVIAYGMLTLVVLGIFLKGFQDPWYWVAGGIALVLILAAVVVGNLLERRMSPQGDKKAAHEVLRELARMAELTRKIQAGQATAEECQQLGHLVDRPLGR